MILEIDNVHTYYGDSHVLHGVSVGVNGGEVVALLGRNGVGKTTLARSIMGLTPARRGQITFRNEEIARLQPTQIARRGIGLVPQGRFVFPSLTVYENLMVASRGDGEHGKGWNIERVLDVFPPLRQRINNRGSALSGGEQQMLAIGRALVTNPSLLVMDEPSEGLAPLMVREVGKLVQTLKEQGYPIFLIEQNLAFALEHADVVYVMSKGTIVFRGAPAELERNDAVTAQYLGI
jgi:branched-chain amino acid transport system ATP-binding protein